jgi:hypothetical protein
MGRVSERDDNRRETMAAVGDFSHRASLPTTSRPGQGPPLLRKVFAVSSLRGDFFRVVPLLPELARMLDCGGMPIARPVGRVRH